MSGYWFKPKTYGYGATPSNWKGWLATLVFVALILATSLLLLPWQSGTASAPSAWQIGAWGVAVALLTAVFLCLCHAKTDGQWAWRWRKLGAD
jgi:hypothetical protein